MALALPPSSPAPRRQVDKEDFGLQPTEVLSMEDKELNELVGMRLLAPYREDGWRLKKTRYKVIRPHNVNLSPHPRQPCPP